MSRSGQITPDRRAERAVFHGQNTVKTPLFAVNARVARGAVLPETRVWASPTERPISIGKPPLLSSTMHWGWTLCGYEIASARLVGHYYPYGQEKPSATTNGTEKFATYFRDSETGLDYADQRFHSPGTGRFLTPDPSSDSFDPKNPISWNRYPYVSGDPVNGTDPSGLCADPISCSLDGEYGTMFDDPELDDFYASLAATTYTDASVSGLEWTCADGSNTCSDDQKVLTAVGPGGGTDPSVTVTAEAPLYGFLGAGIGILNTAGNEAAHGLGCWGIPMGSGAAGGTLFKLGQPVAGTKPFTTPGSSLGTSPISSGLRDGIGTRLPFKIPTPVGGLGTGRPFGIAGTRSLGGAIGRWAPFAGIGGVIYGAVSLNSCLSQ